MNDKDKKLLDKLMLEASEYKANAISYPSMIVLREDIRSIYEIINKLQKENQELKKQLENTDYTSVYLKGCTDTKGKYLSQQKEFIEWLENESKNLIRDAGYHQRICLEILSKYKEIIGGDNK